MAIISHYDSWIARQHNPQSRQQAQQQKATFQAWYDNGIQALSHGELPPAPPTLFT